VTLVRRRWRRRPLHDRTRCRAGWAVRDPLSPIRRLMPRTLRLPSRLSQPRSCNRRDGCGRGSVRYRHVVGWRVTRRRARRNAGRCGHRTWLCQPTRRRCPGRSVRRLPNPAAFADLDRRADDSRERRGARRITTQERRRTPASGVSNAWASALMKLGDVLCSPPTVGRRCRSAAPSVVFIQRGGAVRCVCERLGRRGLRRRRWRVRERRWRRVPRLLSRWLVGVRRESRGRRGPRGFVRR
jgi:hypothetical protein